MNGADITAFGFILMGLTALLFVAFLKIRDKFSRRYYVHWEDKDGFQFYSIIEACSKNGAARKLIKTNLAAAKTNKIVRDARIAR